MLANLKNYTPENIEYVIPQHVQDLFPAELDFTAIKDKKIKSVADAIKFVGKEFSATFPEVELATRLLDDFEISNIREEYCLLQENEVPKRKLKLEETLEEIKTMKKNAEMMYDSILAEVAKYAAEVKNGVKEVQLHKNETFSIALAGYYVIYTFDKSKGKFVLAKAIEIPNKKELWSLDGVNRDAMLKYFGLEFPEAEMSEEEEHKQEENLPFGDDEEEDE